MSALSRKLRLTQGNGLLYWCDGCKSLHRVQFGDGPGPRWTWNGDSERPTFSPSVLTRTGHYAEGKSQADCWICNNPPETNYRCNLCHTFVKDGRVQYLSDCSHHLAGQTVDLPDLPDYLLEEVTDDAG